MRGFDPKWQDVPHFIIGITREIWEDRKIASLRDHDADGLIVHSPASVVVGNSGVITAALATIAEFPDRELPGVDVIWCDDAERATKSSEVFLSSHRLLCTASIRVGAGLARPPGPRSTSWV